MIRESGKTLHLRVGALTVAWKTQIGRACAAGAGARHGDRTEKAHQTDAPFAIHESFECLSAVQLGPALPSIIGPNSSQLSPLNRIICNWSIGDRSVAEVL